MSKPIVSNFFRSGFLNVREKAFLALVEIEKNKAYSNLIANKYSEGMDSRDRGFLRELLYGTVENYIYYEWIISKFSKIKIRKIDTEVKIILKMAVHQIMNLDRVPDSAAVNEAVKLVGKYSNTGAKSFVNGVLRNISRNKETIGFPDRTDIVKYLAVRYSYPDWLIKNWIDDYGAEFTEELCIANSGRHFMNIRVNTLKTNSDELQKILEKEGYEIELSEYSDLSFRVNNPAGIVDSSLYIEGYFDIQDVSSILAGEASDVKPGEKLLDICSAPGGKAVHMAAIMENDGYIEARDIYEHKLKEIEKKAERLGVKILKTELKDAEVFDESDVEKWDICLADVPCSALGLIRNKPEIKFNRTENEMDEFPRIQRRILENASKYVKKGGTIIYSTCTINKRENIELIEKFISDNKEFKFEGFGNNIKESIISKDAEKGYLQLFPNIHDTNGFFIAKLKKY